LNKNSQELVQYISCLNFSFDILVFSAVWTYNIDLFHNLFPGYSFYYNLPTLSKVGGVGIYVKSSFPHSVIDNYRIKSDDECQIKNLWIEISKDQNKYIIGGIYRHPGKKITYFTDKLEKTLTLISNQKLPCLIAGDMNIDLKKYGVHKDTRAYLNSLITNSFSPVVVMPTRITDSNATLIYLILYREGLSKDPIDIKCRNLWCDITDYLPNFVLIERHSINRDKYDSLPYIRLYSRKNIEKFVKLVEESDWISLYNCNSPDSAYILFHHKINKCYDDSFKLVNYHGRGLGIRFGSR